MIRQGSGVILTFGGSGPQTLPGLGGFKIALDALEGLRRQWALELGKYGIRVVTLKTGGIPETVPADYPGREEIVAGIEQAGDFHEKSLAATFVAVRLAGARRAQANSRNYHVSE